MGKYNKINSKFEKDVVFNTYKVVKDGASSDPGDRLQTGTIKKASRGGETLFKDLDFKNEEEIIIEFLYPHVQIGDYKKGMQVSYSTTDHASIHHITFYNEGDKGTVLLHLKGLHKHPANHSHHEKKGILQHVDVNIKHPPGGSK